MLLHLLLAVSQQPTETTAPEQKPRKPVVLADDEALLGVGLTPLDEAGSLAYELILVRSADRVARRSLPAIGELVASWRVAVVSSDEEQAARLGPLLYSALLEPLREDLAGVSRIYWNPLGVLNGVPLDSLPVGDGKFVGDRFEVVVGAPASPRSPSPADSRGLNIFSTMTSLDYDRPGDARSSLDGGELLPLFGAYNECGALATLYEKLFDRDAAPKDYVGESKQVFFERAPGAKAIHIAGYGTSDLQHRTVEPAVTCKCPAHDYSGIAFGTAVRMETEGDVLTASEVRATDLSACGLAFLSCGESALGIARNGQEHPSMAAAFRDAGARSVIGSLWTIGDQNTFRFVRTFYRFYWEDGLPVGQALWEAKRFAKQEGAPTRTWAGWVLTGNPSLKARAR